MKQFIILCISSCLLGACKKSASPVITPPAEPDTTTLKNVSPFKIGAAIEVSLLQSNSIYRNTLLQQYSSITTENTLKWPTVHPSENVFDFSGGDYIADFCKANNIRMHGHCLIWYQANPDWLNNFSGDSLAWENIFKTHIQSVVAQYKGKVTSWDVVNEAFHDEDGSLRVNDVNTTDDFDDGSIWARHLGRDYPARAFMYAHEADTSALLFYNDYGQEWNERKTDSIIEMVNEFKTRGVTINGLGIQMHTDIYASENGIEKAFHKLAATGLLIHISELDITVNPSNDAAVNYTDDLALQQANRYAFIVHQYKQLVPLTQQYGITTWEFSDADSWIRTYLMRKDWPLLFDDYYRRKPAYFTFRKALIN